MKNVHYTFNQIAINVKDKKKPTEEDRHHYIGLEHLDSGSLTVSRWGADVAPKGEKLLMKKGDVLFGKRRAYQKKVGIAPFDGIFSAHGMVLRPNEKIIDKAFFPLFISSDYFLDAAIALSVGSLSPTINWKDLARLEFELPSLEKQRELAEVLWAIEETRTAYQRLEQATDELVKARFVEMFGDPVTNPRGWQKVPLSDLAEIRIGPFGTLLHKEDYIEDGHPIVNPSHIHDGTIVTDKKLTISDEKYEELSAYQLLENDVVMGRRGDMGRCAVVTADGLLCGTGSMIIRSLGEVRADFLQKIISFPSFKKTIEDMAVGQTMQNLNVSIVSRLEIIKPPADVQDAYYDFVEQVDKSKLAVQSVLEKNAAMKASVMREMFR